MIQNSVNSQLQSGKYNITLSGNLLFTGAFNTTFTLSGTTSLTFPTSGTLLSSINIGSTVQGYSAQLASFASDTTNGIVAISGTNTVTSRIISGVASRTTVTNGDGVAGNPTIDISSTYAGQSTITTLGTVGTGTWNGNTINPAFGGTGVNNGTSTIILGGNLTTSGAYTTTLTSTANTSVTLPTSGTLLSSAQVGVSVEAWSAQLDALAALSTNGIIARTAANTVAARVITGTTNLITVTNGDGIAGNPVLTVGSNVSQINVSETRSASINMAANQIKNPELLNYVETSVSLTAAATSTIDVTQGNVYIMSQSVNTALTFSTGAASGKVSSFTLIRIKDATATARTVTWSSTIKWPAGTAPTLTQTSGAVDILEFFSTDGGTTWRGFAAALNSQ